MAVSSPNLASRLRLVALTRYLEVKSTSRSAVSSPCLLASPDSTGGGLGGARVSSSWGVLFGGSHASHYKLVLSRGVIITVDSLVYEHATTTADSLVNSTDAFPVFFFGRLTRLTGSRAV